MKQNLAPSVSVIIPALNEAEMLPKLLRDLEVQNSRIKEIIVVDGGSIDETAALAQHFPKVSVLQAKKANVAFQRNMGAKHASSTWLLFLDADVRLEPSLVKNALAELSSRNLDIGCPLYIPATNKRLIQLLYQFFNAMFLLFEKYSPSGGGMGIIVRKKTYLQAKGFDETLTYEDAAFIRAAAQIGTFGMLSEKIYVSVRRFEKQGILKVFLLYLLLSIFFIFGQFRLANAIKYDYNYR